MDGNEAAVFDLNLEDDDLLGLVDDAITESESFWNGNDKYMLADTVEENVDLWLGRHWKENRVYDYQEENLYVDNRIFTSVETIVELVNSRIANPEIMPAQDSISSRQLAKDVQNGVSAYSKKYRVIDLFRTNTRNMILKRRAYLKLRFDESIGKNGDIVTELIPPEDVVADKDAMLYDNPRFYAHKLRNKTCEDLVAMFPESEQKIFEMFGFQRRNKKGDLIAYKTQMKQSMDIWEVWFTFYEDKVSKEGVMWCDTNFAHVIDKMRNPNYNYEDEDFDEQMANLFDRPMKPFIPFNHLNDGTSLIDQTSMPEQANRLQKILDKRGFQIMENADQAGSGIVFNTRMITKEDMGKLIGAPDERIGVKGDVRMAISRISPNHLPQYVLEDKYDARNEIDNIFATHDVSRGQESNNKTLGQDVMQREQDASRLEGLARGIERSATLYYRYLVQMMKVYYTEEHWFKVTGEDGQFDFVVLKSDLIEDGIEIDVEVGSTMPQDKSQQRQAVIQLAQMGMVDPLTLYETLNIPNAKKTVERLMTYMTDPLKFMNDIQEESFSREALMDTKILNAGEAPKIRDEYPPAYFKFMNDYMLGGEFESQPELTKQLYIEYLAAARSIAQKQLKAMMTQMPTQQDIDMSNQQAIQQASAEQAMMGGASAPPPQQGQQPPPEQPDGQQVPQGMQMPNQQQVPVV